jgi:hypothetical protein
MLQQFKQMAQKLGKGIKMLPHCLILMPVFWKVYEHSVVYMCNMETVPVFVGDILLILKSDFLTKVYTHHFILYIWLLLLPIPFRQFVTCAEICNSALH